MFSKSRSTTGILAKADAVSPASPNVIEAMEIPIESENVNRDNDGEASTIGSFDAGAFSVALGAENGIAETWGLSTVQQGTLTSSVFLGNIIGCPLSGKLFSLYSAKALLIWSLMIHILFTFLFASITDYTVALFCRFFIGVSSSFVIVYTPIWVHDFAPRNSQSVWMASHNAGVPLGIMIGYCLGAFLPMYMNVNWEWAFYLKCILTVPAVANLMRVDRRSIESGAGMRRRQAEESTFVASEQLPGKSRLFDVVRVNILHSWRTCVPLFYNVEYMCSTLAMCSLYFVVTGLQNFVTQYLRDEPFRASMKTIMLGFGAAVVTAPVFGVITGGILLDRIGGYHQNLFRVALFTCAWGSAAAFFSVVCIFVTDTMMFLVVISIVLFCGGAIIPPGSGTIMSCIPERLRPAGAALSQTMFNLLGNFSGPLVCGFVADITGELRYGIYTLFACSVVGLMPMYVLLSIVHRAARPAAPGDAAAAVVVADPPAKADGAPADPSAPRAAPLRESPRRAEAPGGEDSEPWAEPPPLPLPLPLPLPPPLTPVVRVAQAVSAGEGEGEGDEESEESALDLEAEEAQMMSFASQHNFGLDMLRSLLNNSWHSRGSPSHCSSASRR